MQEYRCEYCGRILDLKPDPIRPWALEVPVCQCQLDLLEKAEHANEEYDDRLENLENLEFEAKEIIHAVHLWFSLEDNEESEFVTSDYVIRGLLDTPKLKDKIYDFLVEYGVERPILLNSILKSKGMEEDIKPWPPK